MTELSLEKIKAFIEANDTPEDEAIREALEAKRLADTLYYSGKSGIPDNIYDPLQKKLIELDQLSAPDSTDQPRRNQKQKHRHDTFMSTLLDVKINVLIDWLKKQKEAGLSLAGTMSLKRDGASCSIEYDGKGNMEAAMTRGDGVYGMPLTPIMRYIGVDKITPLPAFEGKRFCVKFEVVVTLEDFDAAREAGIEYNNPRSMASALIASNKFEDLAKYISLVPIQVRVEGDDLETIRQASLEWLETLYKTNPVFVEPCIIELDDTDCDDFIAIIKDLYESVEANKNDYDTAIDGLVFELFDRSLGFKTGDPGYPKYALAIKFHEEAILTKIETIEYDFGYGTGRITPCVSFTPVIANGNTYKRVQLSNSYRFREMKIGVGSIVAFTLQQDLLGYITELPHVVENKKIEVAEHTTECPVCGEALDFPINKDGIQMFAYCRNHACDGNVIGRFVTLFEKMDIKGVSVQTVKKIIEEYDVFDVETLCSFTVEDLESITGFKRSMANIIIKAISELHGHYDYELVAGLRIEGLGKSHSKKVFERVHLSDLIEDENTDIEQIVKDLKIEGIGNSIASKFNQLHEHYDDIMFFYEELGLKDSYIDPSEQDEDFKPLKFVITGSVEFKGKRSGLTKHLVALGHSVSTGISTKVDYLVCNDESSMSSKVQKAIDLKIQIITEDQLFSFIER